jgi:hypothetical protein
MKAALLVCALASCVAGFAAPPNDVSGLVFSLSEFSPNSPNDGTRHELLLLPNGTYTGLLVTEWRETSNPGGTGSVLIPRLAAVAIPPDGTWSYRVLTPETAEIILDQRRLVLTFEPSTRAGRIFGERGNFTPLFSFAEYNNDARIVNVSTRAFVAPGRSISLGFVVSGGRRRVLVRVVGPGLRTFGVSEPLDAPRLIVHPSGSRFPVVFETAWSARSAADSAAPHAGAFPLPAPGDGGALLVLDAGAYIAEVNGSDERSSGEVLVEVYQLP